MGTNVMAVQAGSPGANETAELRDEITEQIRDYLQRAADKAAADNRGHDGLLQDDGRWGEDDDDAIDYAS